MFIHGVLYPLHFKFIFSTNSVKNIWIRTCKVNYKCIYMCCAWRDFLKNLGISTSRWEIKDHRPMNPWIGPRLRHIMLISKWLDIHLIALINIPNKTHIDSLNNRLQPWFIVWRTQHTYFWCMLWSRDRCCLHNYLRGIVKYLHCVACFFLTFSGCWY